MAAQPAVPQHGYGVRCGSGVDVVHHATVRLAGMLLVEVVGVAVQVGADVHAASGTVDEGTTTLEEGGEDGGGHSWLCRTEERCRMGVSGGRNSFSCQDSVSVPVSRHPRVDCNCGN